jgi:hypothetical protein
MIIGSFEPWTHAMFKNSVVVFYRNGMQLNTHQGFSIAGLFSVLFGVRALLRGTLRLAERRVPRMVEASPALDGLAGVAVGLYGLGELAWYVGQMTPRTWWIVGAGPGIWLVLMGGVAGLVAETFLRTHRLRQLT